MIKSGKDEGGYSNRLNGLTIEGKQERQRGVCGGQ